MWVPLKTHYCFVARCTLIPQVAAWMLSRVTYALLKLLCFCASVENTSICMRGRACIQMHERVVFTGCQHNLLH